MTTDELNSLISIRTTLQNAFVQEDKFWMLEIGSSAMISLDALITRSTKADEPLGDIPCPICNSNGVFKYSPIRDCECGGRAWVWSKQ